MLTLGESRYKTIFDKFQFPEYYRNFIILDDNEKLILLYEGPFKYFIHDLSRFCGKTVVLQNRNQIINSLLKENKKLNITIK